MDDLMLPSGHADKGILSVTVSMPALSRQLTLRLRVSFDLRLTRGQLKTLAGTSKTSSKVKAISSIYHSLASSPACKFK